MDLLSSKRWLLEQRIMQENFPSFQGNRFQRNGSKHIGFFGNVMGWEVLVAASEETYPLKAPRIFVKPEPNRSHLESDGALSVMFTWVPNKHTFANLIVLAIRYLREEKRELAIE